MLVARLVRLLPLLLFPLFAACRAPAQDALVFAIATAPASLHPLLATDAVSERINALLYRPMVELDPSAQPVPGIVRWQAMDDRHYLLSLAAGVAPFADGSPVTLADVAASLLQARDNPASPHATALRNIRDIQQQNGHILLVLSQPDPRLPGKLHLGVAPARLLADPQRLARGPVGSGAFRFVSWLDDGGVMLQRRRDGLRVRFAVVPDPTMRALKLLRGEAKLIQNDLPYEMYPVLQRDPAIDLHEVAGSTFAYLGFNLRDPVTADRRVREAVAHAIDRQAIVRYLFMGHAELSNTLLTPSHWATNPGLPAYAYDPARARALLAAAGYGPGHPLRLVYKTSTDPFRLRVAAVIQAQLAEVGIDLQIQSNEWGTFFGDIKAGRFQMYSLSWVGIRSPDIFRHVFHSDSQPPGGANRGRYASAEVDRLIDTAERLPQRAARALYWRVQELVHRDLVYVPLWHENNLLLSRGIEGALPAPDGSYRFLEQVSLIHE